MVKYVTQAEAYRMRLEAMALYEPVALDRVDWMRQPGVVGLVTVDYYVVADNDPRLHTPQPEAGT